MNDSLKKTNPIYSNVDIAPVKMSEEEWKKHLTPEQYRVSRQKGTERPWTSIYEKSTDILGQSVDARSWQDIRIAEVVTEDGTVYIQYQWDDWLPSSWSGVYSLTNYITYTIDGNAIMSSYLGNSSIVSEDNAVVELNSDGVDLISDVVWDTIIVKPV